MRVSSNVYPLHGGFGRKVQSFTGGYSDRFGDQLFTFPTVGSGNSTPDRTVYDKIGYIALQGSISLNAAKCKTICLPMVAVPPIAGDSYILYHVRAYFYSSEDSVRPDIIVGRPRVDLFGTEMAVISSDYFFLPFAAQIQNFGTRTSYDQIVAIKRDESTYEGIPLLFGLRVSENANQEKNNVLMEGHLSVRRFVDQHHYLDPYVQ